MIDLVKRICNPLSEKINNIVTKCTINKTIDSTKTQTTQVELYADEVRENVQRWQNYGFTSVPPKDSEGICLFISGERDQGIIIATEDKDSRPTNLEDGEACLYTKEKDKIHLKKGNKIEIETKSLNIKATDKINIETKETAIKTNKFSVKNDSCELIEILSQVLQILSTTTTSTLMGPMPLKDFEMFKELKTKIDSFK